MSKNLSDDELNKANGGTGVHNLGLATGRSTVKRLKNADGSETISGLVQNKEIKTTVVSKDNYKDMSGGSDLTMV